MGDTLLLEETTFTFAGNDSLRWINRTTTLTAQDETVLFEDSKEGVMALRVARFMEQPYDTPQRLVDNDGKISEEAIVDTTGVTGSYLSSDRLEGDAVWGTRAKWVSLQAHNEEMYYSIILKM